MFNLPTETFWLIFPWPFIWLTLATIMFFIHKRQDDKEDKLKEKEMD